MTSCRKREKSTTWMWTGRLIVTLRNVDDEVRDIMNDESDERKLTF